MELQVCFGVVSKRGQEISRYLAGLKGALGSVITLEYSMTFTYSKNLETLQKSLNFLEVHSRSMSEQCRRALSPARRFL